MKKVAKKIRCLQNYRYNCFCRLGGLCGNQPVFYMLAELGQAV